MDNRFSDDWVTKNQLKDWIGSDNMNSSELVELLHDLINGQYPIDDFKKDVLSY
jgi:hypothetical protein